MKKAINIIGSLLICILQFCGCQQELFNRVVVKGQLVHGTPQQPFSTTVYLYADDVTSSKNSTEGTILLAQTISDANGNFLINTGASPRGFYYLCAKEGIGWGNVYPNGQKSFYIAGSGSKDFGQIFVGW